MQYEVKIFNELLQFINYLLDSDKINSDININIRSFACQFQPEIKVFIRSFAEEIEYILYDNENDIEDIEKTEDYDDEDQDYEKFTEITNIDKKNKILNELYHLKSFIESSILHFEKGNKRIWSMV